MNLRRANATIAARQLTVCSCRPKFCFVSEASFAGLLGLLPRGANFGAARDAQPPVKGLGDRITGAGSAVVGPTTAVVFLGGCRSRAMDHLSLLHMIVESVSLNHVLHSRSQSSPAQPSHISQASSLCSVACEDPRYQFPVSSSTSLIQLVNLAPASASDENTSSSRFSFQVFFLTHLNRQ